MYYCERCHALNETDNCINCHKKHLRLVSADDYCFLIEKEMIWSEMLKEVLDNHGIPYICESSNGAAMGLNMGVALEHYQIFVPYNCYQKARGITEEMFENNN
ncbi:MAG: hypothetical protein RR512_07850 [Coprobacillus sp.]